MATVVNKANGGGPIPNYSSATDRSYKGPNRTLAASPIGVTTPGYVGEIVLDQGSSALWIAKGPTNADWVSYEAQRS